MSLPYPVSELIRRHGRLIRFVVSGGFAALVLLGASYGLLVLGWRPFIANAVGYGIAFVVGYSLQRGWTFEARHAHGHALPRYIIVQLGCGLLAAVSGEVLIRFGTPKLAASVVTTLLVSGISYLASSLWVFPTGDRDRSA